MPAHAIQREKPKCQAPVPNLDADMPPLQLLNDEVRLALHLVMERLRLSIRTDEHGQCVYRHAQPPPEPLTAKPLQHV